MKKIYFVKYFKNSKSNVVGRDMRFIGIGWWMKEEG
jgi:hypothetical protein